MKPQIVPTDGMGGKFNMVLTQNQLNRHYMVTASAPEGLQLTAGVCNNKYPGWECDPGSAIVNNRKLGTTTHQRQRALDVAIGIPSGRSTQCVFVDNMGNVQSPLSFGVMRVGDTQNMASNVALVLEFDGGRRHQRHLTEMIRRASVLDEVDNGSHITTRYLLAEEDRMAIGTVTAEVTASALDSRLAENGVNLDSVKAKEVIMSNSRLKDDAAAAAVQAQLAVGMEIRGHYSPPPDLDFDYIVQDSINRDTATIRRGLREYNRNCREQTTKINKEGLQESDFTAVLSSSGAARPGRGGGRPVTTGSGVSQMTNVFSTACSSQMLVPEYFETSLKEIETLDISEVKKFFGDVTYLASDGGLDSWAVGPVAGLAGLIVLLMGAFVFRRALGPRHVDVSSDALKTKDVGKDEKRRFGEDGGDYDDGSVDSAFYSDSDDDLEETEKERKMRRKRKDKEDEQKGLTKSQKARKKNKEAAAFSSSSSGNVRKSSRGVKGRGDTKLTVSQGSDDTFHSNSSDDVDMREKKRAAKERAAERKKLANSSAKKGSSGKSSSTKQSSRGRNRKSGGDNARIV